MTTLTKAQLIAILPMPDERATKFINPLNTALEEFCILTPKQVVAFLANTGHESANFGAMIENLNYSAEGLSKTWPARYAVKGTNGKPIPGTPNPLAKSLHMKKEAIANNVYADRMGNGPEASGDGWKYRGRSPIGLTGKDNYTRIGKELGLDLVNHPELLEEPIHGMRAAANFWKRNNINLFADKDDIDGCCDCVNIGRKTAKEGDAIGYGERRVIWMRGKKVLGI